MNRISIAIYQSNNLSRSLASPRFGIKTLAQPPKAIFDVCHMKFSESRAVRDEMAPVGILSSLADPQVK